MKRVVLERPVCLQGINHFTYRLLCLCAKAAFENHCHCPLHCGVLLAANDYLLCSDRIACFSVYAFGAIVPDLYSKREEGDCLRVFCDILPNSWLVNGFAIFNDNSAVPLHSQQISSRSI